MDSVIHGLLVNGQTGHSESPSTMSKIFVANHCLPDRHSDCLPDSLPACLSDSLPDSLPA